MPIGVGTGLAITAGAGLLGQGANAYATGKTNKKTREWSDTNYWRDQRQKEIWWKTQTDWDNMVWARQNKYDEERWNAMNRYNEERWRLQNEYDSPAAQMARYKAAGLNPNLIYGQQNTGGSFYTGNQPRAKAGSPNAGAGGSGTASGRYIAPQFDFQSVIVDALRAQNIEKQNDLISAQTTDTLASAEKKGVETGNMKQLINHQVDALKEQVQSTRQKRLFEAELQPQRLMKSIRDLKEQAQRMRNMDAKYDLDRLEFKLKRYEISFRHGLELLDGIQQNLFNPIEKGIMEQGYRKLPNGKWTK